MIEYRNLSMREAVKKFRELGGDVVAPRCTGELLFSHHSIGRKFRVNGRRKDATIQLMTTLRRLKRSA